MVTVSIISICATIGLVFICYMIQSERNHARAERQRLLTERKQLEKDLKDAQNSHNLARIALIRGKLRRLPNQE